MLALPEEGEEYPQSEAEGQWNKDSKMYEECRTSKAALVDWYARRDAAITGEPLKQSKPRKPKAKPKTSSVVPRNILTQ